MTAPIHLALNIADIQWLIENEVAKRYAGLELGGFTVTSYSTVVMRVEAGMLVSPVRHQVHEKHASLDWPS